MNINLSREELDVLLFSLQSLSYDDEMKLTESLTSVSALYNKIYSVWENGND